MNTPILSSFRDEDGKIQNGINHTAFLNQKMMPDVYFCFILKTLIDDFGSTLEKATQGKINKEQFEATLLDNLRDMLPEKTKI